MEGYEKAGMRVCVWPAILCERRALFVPVSVMYLLNELSSIGSFNQQKAWYKYFDQIKIENS